MSELMPLWRSFKGSLFGPLRWETQTPLYDVRFYRVACIGLNLRPKNGLD
jgi:hypothetical protein